MLILFLGRSTEGILADARKEFGEDHEALVLTRDGDTMPVPTGVESLPASSFQPKDGLRYVVVANGGTTSQLVPTLKKLVEAKADFEAYDLQRDGAVRVW